MRHQTTYFKLGSDSQITIIISEDLYKIYKFDIISDHISKIYFSAIAACREVINTFPEYRNKVFMLKGKDSINLYIFREGKKMKCGRWRYTYDRSDVNESEIVDAYEDDHFIVKFNCILYNKFGAAIMFGECIVPMLSTSVYHFAIETSRLYILYREFHFGFIDYYKRDPLKERQTSFKFLAAEGIID